MVDLGEKGAAAMLRINSLRATLGRRPLVRLAVHTSIALLTLGLIIIYSHKWRQASEARQEALVTAPPAGAPPSPPPPEPPKSDDKKPVELSFWDKIPNDTFRQDPVRATPLAQALQALFQPMIVDMTSPRFQTQEGDVYEIADPKNPLFTKPLGERMCIVDMDGRPFDGQNEIFSELPIDLPSLKGGTSGILNHYLYAHIHGYKYYFIKTTPAPDRRSQVWEEMRATRELLETGVCDYVLNLDTDAVFVHLELPLEWMMNRWNVSDDYVITMAVDPDTPIHKTDAEIEATNDAWIRFNRDEKKRVWGNPGVSIIRNSPLAIEMLNDWWSCPDDEARYPGCNKWRGVWPAEMTAFANYLRYEDKYKNHINELACQEINGFPEMRTECLGLFIKHFTTDKSLIKAGMLRAIERAVVNTVHQAMFENKGNIIVNQWKLKEETAGKGGER